MPDLATEGAAVAQPATPDSALFMNPAGLVRFATTTYTGSFGVIRPHTEVDSDLADYHKSDTRFAFNPSGGVSVPLAPGWRFGAGVYGSVGTVFDFEAEPPTVSSDFVSDVAIGAAPLGLAYEATPDLAVGVALVPLFGYLRNRFELPDTGAGALPIHYTLRGPGIQALLGLSYDLDERWSFGASLRTPGMIWMDGSTEVAGDRVDVDCNVKMPTVVWLGATRHIGERLDLSASFRWTDASTFGESKIEFAGIHLPFVPDAQDEWRYALGADYEWSERLMLRGGVSYSSRIVGNKGVSPLLFDTEDTKLGGGFTYAFHAWSLHAMGGYAFKGKRTVEPGDALILPGDYEADGPIVMLGFSFPR